jgi:hypothetical protein
MCRLVFLLAAALLSTGCLTTGMYRTAHVLPQDEGDFTMSFNVVRATVEEPAGEPGVGSETFTYPNVVPEISYHYGMAENVEVGGRLALGAGMIEVDTKWRFLHTPGLHLAVQPAVGYRGLGFFEGFHGSLPLILTRDLRPRMSLNASVFGSYTHFTATDSFDDGDIDLVGDTVFVGGALGVQFRSRGSFHFMPAIEVQRSVYRGGDLLDAPDVTAVIFGVSVGWGADERARKMDEQLDRIERKLDRPAP